MTVILCILDGWGLGDGGPGDAPHRAHTPVMDRLTATCPHATLVTHGGAVGLPEGQMGNSEVGHTTIGAGRVILMDLPRIDAAVADGSFAEAPALVRFADRVTGTAHLMGLVSDGGVHGHWRHLVAAAEALTARGRPVAVHAITDGRDVGPTTAPGFLAELEAALPEGARIATVIGRYWAMDRDRRWDRVERAFRAMVRGEGERAVSPGEAVRAAHAADVTDEFVPPTVIGEPTPMRDGDGLFCLNFRADRARQITAAIADPRFSAFEAGPRPSVAMLGLAEYSDAHRAYMDTAFPRETVHDTLGEVVSRAGLTQLRLAETEKYPHVTFFLNGGRERAFEGEARRMPPSPKVATYDRAPEMAAEAVADRLVEGIRAGHDLIVVNFANPDMLGHTGDLGAAIRACEAVDAGLGRALDALGDGAMVVCADHGNCEVMIDADGGPHTAHTLNAVPVLLVGGPEGARLRGGGLGDLAPTLLDLMGVARPEAMTGRSLVERA